MSIQLARLFYCTCILKWEPFSCLCFGLKSHDLLIAFQYWFFSATDSYFLLLSYWEHGKIRLAYRPVHMNTLDDEIESFPPKARVY